MTDKETFCEQILQNEKAMYSLAYSVVKNDADAAEILSESILRAYQKKDSLKSFSSFQAWILRIVHNTAIDYIRKNSAYLPVEIMDVPIEDTKEQLLTSLSLKEAIRSLSQPYRTVIVLYYYENLSTSQIASITDVSIVTVRQRLSRARKQLREILKEDFRYE